MIPCILTIQTLLIVPYAPQEDALSTKLAIEDWSSEKRTFPHYIPHSFDHCFHWPRKWYAWNVYPYYFWWGSCVYLHARQQDASCAWTITNDTPGILIIWTPDSITAILPGNTEKIPRNHTQRFQLYSHYTGERKQIHTPADAIRVLYYPTQDYLIILPETDPCF